jgi:quinol monooxygenase YgiN
MVKIIEMNDKVTLNEQFKDDVGAVILMNKFNVTSDEAKEFLEVFAEATKFFRQQPGLSQLSCTEELRGVPHSLIM